MQPAAIFLRAYLRIAHGAQDLREYRRDQRPHTLQVQKTWFGRFLFGLFFGFLALLQGSCGVDRLPSVNGSPLASVPRAKPSPSDSKDPENPSLGEGSSSSPLAASLQWICGGGDQLLVGSSSMGPLDTPQSIDIVEASSSRRVSPLLHPQILSANAQGAEILLLSTQSGMAELFRGRVAWNSTQASVQRLGTWKAPEFLANLMVTSSSDPSSLVVNSTTDEVLVPEERNWAIWHLPSGRKTFLPMGSFTWSRPQWSADGNWIVATFRNEKGRERLGIFERSSAEIRPLAPAFDNSDQFSASLSVSGQIFCLERIRNPGSKEKLILRRQHLTDRKPGWNLHEWTSKSAIQHSFLYAYDAAQKSQVGIVVKNSSDENEFFWFSVETNKRDSKQMSVRKIPSPEIFQHLFWSPEMRSWLISLKNSRGFWSFDTSNVGWRGVGIAPASQAFLCRHPAFVEVEK
ncbi:MAG: hypothetical protein WCH11_04855 [Bdellovibrio sp.]